MFAPLVREPLSAQAAAELAGQSTISHLLKVLRTAGLLDSERRGSWVYYRVIPAALQQLSLLLGPDALSAAGVQ